MYNTLEHIWIGFEVGPMIRLNTSYFYYLGYHIHPLTDFNWNTGGVDAIVQMHLAGQAIQSFLADNIVTAPLSKNKAWELKAAVDKAMETVGAGQANSPPTTKLNADGYAISETAKQFEHVLAAELAQSETYVASQKGIFDTKSLVDNADAMFSGEVRIWLPQQSLTDIKNAGRCLAFELPTACGFHLMRGVETAIKHYYFILSGGEEFVEAERSWMKYIKRLKDQGADGKVLSALDQMRELHRNPITHPEVDLTLDEALMLFGLSQSAIIAIVMDANKRSGNMPLPLSEAQTHGTEETAG